MIAWLMSRRQDRQWAEVWGSASAHRSRIVPSGGYWGDREGFVYVAMVVIPYPEPAQDRLRVLVNDGDDGYVAREELFTSDARDRWLQWINGLGVVCVEDLTGLGFGPI